MNQSFRNNFFLPTSRTRRTVRWVRRLILALLLPLLSLAALGQWWLLPRLNDYRDDVANVLQEALHVPVRIETVTAIVDGWHLALGLRGVSLDNPDRDATLAHFNQVAITLNLWRSLREWQPVVRRIRLEGANITLQDDLFRRKPDAGKSLSLSEVAYQIFGLRQLEIVGEQLAIRRADGAAWQLLNSYLRLQDTARGRRLALTADLPTDFGERLELTIEPLSTDKVAGEMRWRLQGQVHFADQPGQALTPTQFEATQTARGWQAVIRHLRAEDLLVWAKPWLDESARQWLTPLDPRGELSEVTWQSESATGAYQATAFLSGIDVHSTHGLPGFENVTGRIHFTPEQGRIALDSRAVQVDTVGLLRAPITFDTLSGTVTWQRSDEGLQVASTGLELANADLNGRFWGSFTVPDVGGPVLDIQGRYHDVNVKQAWRYLPVAVIPPKGVNWLDRALVDGQVTTGELIFRGPPGAFPFDQDEGLFETHFQTKNAVLDYAPGEWPRLEQLEAEVRFRNRGLTVTASSGRLLDGVMEGATTRIEDLAKVVVQVVGRAKGPGVSMWRALKESPLGGGLGEDLPNLQISGSNTLDLDLTLPTDSRPSQARGRVGLLNNDLKLPAWKVELERLRGEVRFTQADLEAQRVKALWRGTPIWLDLDLAGREGQRELRTQIQGKLGLPVLVGQAAAMALEAQIVGVSDWKAVLTAPTQRRQRQNGESAISLELSSDLRGTAIDLPAPLGKAASTARLLKIKLQPDEGNRWVVALEYAPEARAMLELSSLLDTPRFERGELRLNAGAARLPEEPGLAIIANLPRWEWADPAKAPSDVAGENGECASAKTQDQSVNPLALVRRLEARIDELTIAGQSFAKMTVHAHRGPQGLQVELDSPDLSGQITVPDDPTQAQPVNALLQRLQVQRKVADTPKVEQGSAMNPCRLPPAELTVADLRMNEQNLGRLQMTVTPRPGGVRLSGIELNSQQQQIDAEAEWWWNGGDPISRLNVALRSPDLGETLAMFGYPQSGIAGGSTQAQLDAEWAAGLPDFALERISGTLKFQVGSGQLLEINPGLGRMIGLFNVQNLQRRLSLDFSDLFQPGTSFDEISGEFAFKNGQARTDNMSIEAPAAQIDIQGRVGLKDRDFNQQITVTPELGGTLPIAGAIVGGPAAGAAMFVAERLLQKNIEQVTRYQYRLTGSWDDPLLEPLTLKQTPVEPTPRGTPHSTSRPRQGFASDN